MSKVNLLGGKRKIDNSLMETKTKSLISHVNSIDISDLNLLQLTSDLRASLTKPEPMTIFFRRRQVKKLELDVERQRWLLNKVVGLRALGQELVQLRADAIVSEQMVTFLAQKNLMDAEIEFQTRVNELTKVNRDIKQVELEMKSIDYQVEDLETIKLQRLESLRTNVLENDRIAADNEAQKIKNRAQEAKAKLMEKFANEIDVASLPFELQSYAVSHLFSEVGSNFSEYEKDQIYNKYFEKELEVGLKKKQAEVKSAESQADVDRSSADVTVKDYKQSLDEED